MVDEVGNVVMLNEDGDVIEQMDVDEAAAFAGVEVDQLGLEEEEEVRRK